MLIIACLFCAVLQVHSAGLNEEFTWTRLNYVYPQESRFGFSRSYGHKPMYGGAAPLAPSDFMFPGAVNPAPPRPLIADVNNDANGGNVDYIYENNIPMGANRWGDKLFITVPRRRNGVPSTLNYVSMSNPERHNVPLTPYPNWDANQLDAPSGEKFVSVYRVAVDVCDRLWVLDTGIMEIPNNRTILQPHSITIIDLKTDQIIRRYNLNPSDVRAVSALALITVDVTKDTCDDAHAYLPDLAGYGLVVYSLRSDTSWRVSHNYFFLESLYGDFNIGGQQFQWNDGVFSVALSALNKDGNRDMYFHSMAGIHLFKVNTRVLKNETLATRSNHEADFIDLGARGPLSQTSATDLHKQSGVLFLSLVNQNALGCYNTNKPFKRENFAIIQKDAEKMIYPCDLKIYKDQIILLTNNMPIFLYSTLNYDQINFRIWTNTVQNAISGTNCESRRKPGGYQG